MNKEKVFNDFYKKEFNNLLNWLTYSYPNLINAEDLLQDTFISWYQNYLEKYDGSIKLKSYFVNYLVMCANGGLKKEAKNKPVSMDVEYPVGNKIFTLKDMLVDADNSNTIDEKLLILDTIISGLNSKWMKRYELLLLFIKGLSYEEIVIEKNITLATVKNHIRLIRIYICEEYSNITGTKLEFVKEKKDSRLYYNEHKLLLKEKRELQKIK